MPYLPQSPERRASMLRLRSDSRPAVPQPEQPPRDCVRVFPVVGRDAVRLVGFDSAGTAQIEVLMDRARLNEGWEARMLRWVRQWDKERIQLVK